MEYKVITQGCPKELWAMGFYGDWGKAKAKELVDQGYFHRYMYAKDKHKKLEVVAVVPPTKDRRVV